MVLRTSSALLPASFPSPASAPVPLAHPNLLLVSQPGLTLRPLRLEGHRLQPSLAQSPLPATRLSPPGSAKTGAIFPLPPRPRGLLYLQLELGRPRLPSRRDPHLPPSSVLIGRCLTTDPHNKTSGLESHPLHFLHQSVASDAPPSSEIDQ